ncbi:779_t:CDS:2 [Paraglomus brasilianum]|uniref:Pseudouridine synthase n=1 Tax=Paraglomus brasilianum TaxID=144538 RepID=A0A9N8WMX8_9GLOM|nr:779_t:CDS:2 [Paraglomus brasilianum]
MSSNTSAIDNNAIVLVKDTITVPSKHRYHASEHEVRKKLRISSNKQLNRKDISDICSIDEVEYHFENDLRKVKPYYYEYRTFTKKRWIGRTILDVFTTEFRDRSPQYYVHKNDDDMVARAIKRGSITVNKQTVSTDTILRNQDLITHKIHRHEPPVTAEEIKIICRKDDLIVINKPGSIPVHPSGRYLYNTVLHILRKEHQLDAFHTINRLDRLTSGITLIAMSKQKARELEEQIRSRNVQKDEEIICDQPIKCVSHKLGLNSVSSDGKPSTTVFNRMHYNGHTSVVRCKPITGRTHQIRVHLQYLGYPIANDPLYNHPSAWGPSKGKGGFDQETTAKVIEYFMQEGLGDEEKAVVIKPETGEEANLANGKKLIISENDNADEQDEDEASGTPIADEETPCLDEDYCEECANQKFNDPLPHQLCIWLHALKYEGDGWKYETELPEWAKTDFVGDRDISVDGTSIANNLVSGHIEAN